MPILESLAGVLLVLGAIMLLGSWLLTGEVSVPFAQFAACLGGGGFLLWVASAVLQCFKGGKW